MARDHRAGVQVEPRAARLGELLPSWLSHQSVSGARQLHSSAVAPVVALQAQGQATQGRDLSTLAPLDVNQHRTGTPLAIGANTFIQCDYQRFGGVPIGARSGPSCSADSRHRIKVVTPAGAGSRFGADSHQNHLGLTFIAFPSDLDVGCLTSASVSITGASFW